jgi:hypothetical protein
VTDLTLYAKLSRSAVKFGISNFTADLRNLAQRQNLSLALYFGQRFKR